ncbi:glycine zipper family protein [Vibrio breoganii]|uniref:glycine zipper family protein n=1 Tax=Vibrio breoganii TaxID=553239 RepID=UPI003BAEF1E2
MDKYQSFTPKSTLLLLIASLFTVTGCASNEAMDAENKNAGRNRGAIGGALLGATAGALTGDASLAAKGAVAGGVAGGVAGSMKDVDDARSKDRTEIQADGLKQDNRSDAEKRLAELEAEVKIKELEAKLADMEEQKDGSEES